MLALSPEVLAFDEPMSGLDARTRRFLCDITGALRAAGRTIICAAHDLEHAAGLFSRPFVLSVDHMVARDGALEAVLADRAFLRAHNIL